MTAVVHPPLREFVARIGDEIELAQALIRRAGAGYELRHVADRDRAAKTLRELMLTDLRVLTQFTTAGAFRPLKAAPNLPSGWLVRLEDDAALEAALNQLYPGAMADWFAAQSPAPPVTNYREFTQRQTGRYRITAMLADAQAARVARACCDKDFCLKRRLWTVNGLAPEAAEGKSLIPCLEPCAVLLEFARATMQIEQDRKMKLELSPCEAATLAAALETALRAPRVGLREADFAAAANPRRLRLLREKIQPLAVPGAELGPGE